MIDGLVAIVQQSGTVLQARGWMVATAESCTGGLVGHLLTELPGSSSYYQGGVIAYSNEAKRDLLGVPQEMLQTSGAVSEATARAMAEGVRARFDCAVGLSTTGIAGPGGATDTKPVGLVFVAVATPTLTICQRFVFDGDRAANKQESALAALRLLLETV